MITINGYAFTVHLAGRVELTANHHGHIVEKKCELSVIIANDMDMAYAMEFLQPCSKNPAIMPVSFIDNIGQHIAVDGYVEYSRSEERRVGKEC